MNWKAWIGGIAAAFISAFATAASGALALPTVFTPNKIGLINIVKMATVPAMLSVFTFLAKSPIWGVTINVPAGDNQTVKATVSTTNPITKITNSDIKEP